MEFVGAGQGAFRYRVQPATSLEPGHGRSHRSDRRTPEAFIPSKS